ncbi:peptide ABC transporter substrate-binding protein [Chromatiales bacterium (ex Bugula neritina AB1)]|nr:peptide ABC transporter substrate-binding protein [Chromatiales bacterium (ex Bugula neritina AB1)]
MIKRRTLLKGAVASAGLLSLGFSLPAAAAPKKGGRLVIGTTGGAVGDSLDPRKLTSVGHGIMGYALGNCLTEIEKDGNLVGELAESWDSTADATVWTFNLRKGVTFHNGQAMTSADVVYSLNLHRGEDSKSGAKGLLGSITDISADGPDAIKVSLSAGNADMPYLMADFHLLIVPDGTEDFAKAVFTGPYMLKEFLPGERLLATRNPDYWKADRAHVDEVEVLFVDDTTARISGLMTGEIHIAGRVDPQSAALISSAPGVHIENHAAAGHRPLLMLCDRAPFDNADLRMAVKYSLDREQILETVMAGYGSIANDHPIPPFDPFHASDIPQRTYDPDKAAHHLKKSGFDGTLPLHTSNTTFPGAEAMAALVQQSAAAAGLKMDIVREPADGFWSKVWMQKSFVSGAWGGRPTADIMLTTAYSSEAAWNDTMWRRKDFDEKLVAARAEVDFDKRKAHYHDLQLMIQEDGGAGIPFFVNNVDGVRDNVEGFYPAGSFELSGMRVTERVWLNA